LSNSQSAKLIFCRVIDMDVDLTTVVASTVVGASLVYFLFGLGKKHARAGISKGRQTLTSSDSFTPSASFRDTSASTGGGLKNRVSQAREHPVPREQTYASILAQAQELKKSGGLWRDPEFTHDEESLFEDADNPPNDWLRDGERGAVLNDVHVKWCPPGQFCMVRKNQRNKPHASR
jgi:hypothetical protein